MIECKDALELCHDLIDSGLPLYAVSVVKERAFKSWTVVAQAAGVQAVVDEVVEAASVIRRKKQKRLTEGKESSFWQWLINRFYSSDEPVVQLIAPVWVLVIWRRSLQL